MATKKRKKKKGTEKKQVTKFVTFYILPFCSQNIIVDKISQREDTSREGLFRHGRSTVSVILIITSEFLTS